MSNTISAADFGHLLSSGQAQHVIDVRTPEEFAACHVKGAELFPLDVLNPQQLAEKFQPTAEQPIYILCRSGMRAGKAADQCAAQGVNAVVVVDGGTEACVTAGLPVDRWPQ